VKRLAILLFSLGLISGVYSQESFYILEDFGHHQARGYSIEEIDKHLYVIGMAIADSDSIFEENIHISKYDLEGNHIKSIFFDNDRENGSLNGVKDQSISLYNDKLLITINIGANINEAIILVDKDLTDVELISYYSIGPTIGIIGMSHYLTNDAQLVIPIGSSQFSSLVGNYDLRNDIFQVENHSTNIDHRYLTSKILPIANDSLLVIGGIQTRGDDNSFSTGQSTTFFLKLDPELNFVSESLIEGKDYGGIADFIHALKKSNDEIIVMGVEVPRDDEGIIPNSRRQVIFSYQPSSNKILWDNVLSDGVFKRRFDFNQSFIFSHDSTEYITVGLKYPDPNIGGPFIATIQKVDSMGNNVWYKELPDVHPESGLTLYDVIATSDGHYVACGDRFDRSENDGFETLLQQFLIKFDEDGNIVDRVTATTDDEEELSLAVVSIYPNPAKNQVTIEKNKAEQYSYQLYASSGQLVKTLIGADTTTVIDVTTYKAGTYFLKVLDSEGKLVHTEQLVIGL